MINPDSGHVLEKVVIGIKGPDKITSGEFPSGRLMLVTSYSGVLKRRDWPSRNKIIEY